MIEAAVSESFPAEVGFTAEGRFCLRLPLLLPKKGDGSPAYIGDSLYTAMKRFRRDKPPVCYPHNVIAFRHVYDRKRPERQL